MITSELSSFLENDEKESVLKAISASDKILASGICQFLIGDGEEWCMQEAGAAVVLFLKNSSERYYRIIVIEPSSDAEWEPRVQFDFLVTDRKFETMQLHAKLLTFEHDGKDIGLHFYNSKECENFHNSVCKRQSAKSMETSETPALEGKKKKKEKKKGLWHSLFHKETRKTMEIGEPTNFRHIDGVKMTAGQEDLYMQVMSKLQTRGPEEEEFVKQLVVRNEDKFRQSMMVKKETQTVKVVKEKSKEKEKSRSFFGRSKSKIEDVSQPVVPVLSTGNVDPLKPDWSSGGSTVASSSFPTSPSFRSASSTVTVTSSFKHSHTFAADPLKDSDWETPRRDAYGITNDREPQNIYKFEQERVEERYKKEELEETPPEIPSRGASRNISEPITRTGLASPRLPSHRGSYRWATQPETIPKQPPLPPSLHSHNSHQVDDFAELKLSSKAPIRTAPPPPPSTPPTLKTEIRGASSLTKPTTQKVAPPPPSPSPVTPAPPISQINTSMKSPPPPPPIPPIAPPSSIPPPPPPPPPPPMIHETDDDIENSGRTIRLSAVPESSSDRRSLMDQIRSTDRSKVLKKVSDQPDSRQSITSPASGTIVDQIQNFLDARRAGINPSDSEGSEDDDDDDDWKKSE